MEWVQHSSGSWKLEGPDYVCGGYNVPRWRVRGSHGETIGELYAFNGADARRIVACVNACKGILTEALESGVVRELIEAATRYLAATTRESDDDPNCWAEEEFAMDRLREVLCKVWGVRRDG